MAKLNCTAQHSCRLQCDRTRRCKSYLARSTVASVQRPILPKPFARLTIGYLTTSNHSRAGVFRAGAHARTRRCLCTGTRTRAFWPELLSSRDSRSPHRRPRLGSRSHWHSRATVAAGHRRRPLPIPNADPLICRRCPRTGDTVRDRRCSRRCQAARVGSTG